MAAKVPYEQQTLSTRDATDNSEVAAQAVTCVCGHVMVIKPKHIGTTGYCNRCHEPVTVSPETIHPYNGPIPTDTPRRHFRNSEIPVNWRKGDRFMATYEVVDLVGKGGMALVHRVHHSAWGVDLAVKTPKPEILPCGAWQEEFERECETWVNLDPHPNVVKCHYVRRLGGIPRIFMEYIEGGALSRAIAHGRVHADTPEETFSRIIDIGVQMARGLEHAHANGLVHQDIKPANILLTHSGLVKVTDFGLVRAIGNIGAGEKTSEFYTSNGTPHYSSPEQASRQAATPRSDTWSLGVTLMEMLIGRVLWTNHQSARDTLDAYAASDIDDAAFPHPPQDLLDLVGHCLRNDPSERPANMREIQDALKDIQSRLIGKPYDRAEPSPSVSTAANLNNRAVSLLDLGKHKEAQALWERALSIDPAHVESSHNRLLHSWRRGSITDIKVLRAIQRMCAEKPGDWLPHYLLGRVLLEWGDCRTAKRVLTDVPVTDHNRREIRFAIASADRHALDTRRLMREFQGNHEVVESVCLSPDGSLAASGSRDGTMRLWKSDSRECIKVINGHKGPVLSLCATEDGHGVLSAGGDACIRLWDVTNGQCLREFKGHEATVRSVRMSRNGGIVVSGSRDHTVRVWDLESGECMSVLKGHEAAVNCVDVSTCGGYAVSGGRDHTLKYWATATGECLRSIRAHNHRIHAVCMFGDHHFALSASSGPRIRLWDLTTGHRVRTYEGHTTEAYSLCVSENQRFLLSGSRNGTIKLWDLATGQCLRSFSGSAPVCLSRDGRFALSGDADGVLRLWLVACDVHLPQAPYALSRESLDTP